ncbi:DUF1634 domain-containing protein [Pedobacter foliorum]|uniref:DUF1634 domain-containing protein n=1 Tax=Pedobacter foliorum TaxID=2739058 RepID=UPI001564316A|nr:DUF1634 domain-containing protein [Pedobacter foliorum]NRF40004.1 DUF1634 domain-containing protein [Pedobacter foliorum]
MSKENKNFFADRDIQIILGTLLRVGVIASMSVVFIGGLVYLAFNHSEVVNYSQFDSAKSGFSTISEIFIELGDLKGSAIIQFGILLLIFTPIMRVVFSIFSFLIERDYLYVLIGAFVLCVILFSLSNKLVG